MTDNMKCSCKYNVELDGGIANTEARHVHVRPSAQSSWGFLQSSKSLKQKLRWNPVKLLSLKKDPLANFQCEEAAQYLRTQSGCKKHAINGCSGAVLGCENASEGSFKAGCGYIRGKIIGHAEFPTEGKCEAPARKAPAPRS
ncbi:unnamed protein product [Mucor hiemalis]